MTHEQITAAVRYSVTRVDDARVTHHQTYPRPRTRVAERVPGAALAEAITMIALGRPGESR